MPMTVAEASKVWNVNRRTILKWILGKDSTGRGKRMAEGRDYTKARTENGLDYYVILIDSPPLPSLAPIPYAERTKRGSRYPSGGVVEETAVVEEEPVVVDEIEGEFGEDETEVSEDEPEDGETHFETEARRRQRTIAPPDEDRPPPFAKKVTSAPVTRGSMTRYEDEEAPALPAKAPARPPLLPSQGAKRGRPTLSEEEKARRAEEKAAEKAAKKQPTKAEKTARRVERATATTWEDRAHTMSVERHVQDWAAQKPELDNVRPVAIANWLKGEVAKIFNVNFSDVGRLPSEDVLRALEQILAGQQLTERGRSFAGRYFIAVMIKSKEWGALDPASKALATKAGYLTQFGPSDLAGLMGLLDDTDDALLTYWEQ